MMNSSNGLSKKGFDWDLRLGSSTIGCFCRCYDVFSSALRMGFKKVKPPEAHDPGQKPLK